jgi:hypothetical protein
MCWGKRKQSFIHPLTERSFSFESLALKAELYRSLIEENRSDPYAVAALTLVALALYALDPESAFAMLSELKAPALLSLGERRFIAERLAEGKDYKPYSYFAGALPQNNYRAEVPYVVKVFERADSFQDEGYASLYLQSSGASSPRLVRLRKRSDGGWALWEEFLLADIIAPKKDNPWA